MTLSNEDIIANYGIDAHRHRLAAWAAASAAPVKGTRFTVERAVGILKKAGFDDRVWHPDDLPDPTEIDARHREWRDEIIKEATTPDGKTFSHGIAAKLINVYLKVRFVCAGYHDHPRVAALHPPIDRLLLKGLAAQNVGCDRAFWKKTAGNAWSNLESEPYDEVIRMLRRALGENVPLWKAEVFWSGYQAKPLRRQFSIDRQAENGTP